MAEALSRAERVAASELVVTGEGLLDAESFDGNAVGGVLRLAAEAGVAALVIVGDALDDELPQLPRSVEVVSLARRFGAERAMADVAGCVEEVVAARLR